MKSIIEFLVALGAIGVGLYKAMVFMFLFNWFVVEIFSVEPINYWMSVALILTISILTFKNIHKSLIHYESNNIGDDQKIELNVISLIGMLVSLSFALFIGWIIQLNM